jgi:hypothetical protein
LFEVYALGRLASIAGFMFCWSRRLCAFEPVDVCHKGNRLVCGLEIAKGYAVFTGEICGIFFSSGKVRRLLGNFLSI